MILKLISLSDFCTAVFEATLPTTTSIIRGKIEEEQAQALAKRGKLASEGNMFHFLGSMMYKDGEFIRTGQSNKEGGSSLLKGRGCLRHLLQEGPPPRPVERHGTVRHCTLSMLC